MGLSAESAVSPETTADVVAAGHVDTIEPMVAIEPGAACESMICEKKLNILTKRSRSTYCDLIKDTDAVGDTGWFISHTWSYRFLDVVKAINLFFEGKDDKEPFIWFDIFSNSQYIADGRQFEWWGTSFMNSIKEMGKVIMILLPWDNPVILTRAWCVLEVYASHKTGSSFHVAMTKKESARFSEGMIYDADEFYEMLARVSCQKSDASLEVDKENIFALVKEQVGFGNLDRLVLQVFGDWMLSKLQDMIVDTSGEDKAHLQDALADLRVKQGKYKAAKSLYINALTWKKEVLGEDHQNVLVSLNNLAVLYQTQGLHTEAESLGYWGRGDPDTLASLNNLAILYDSQGLYTKAELLHPDCLARRMRVLSEDHHDTLDSLGNLAILYKNQGLYSKAEPLFVDCLARTTRTLGMDHPDTLQSLNNLAALYNQQRLYTKAVPLCVICVARTATENDPNLLQHLIFYNVCGTSLYKLGH
ncbi:Kinesin light chain 3 [Physocladia obscura]|uniref:Kinesin light chain 3 n=1 Tax=Physocladia obscura TaxID=109957 RepID=A0AAD5SVF8_9FUNG|nr:Kinesin light chain 3 [Physocladia obscura]